MTDQPARRYIWNASPLLTDEVAVDAAARVHVDWEGYPDSHGSIREQAAAIVAAFVGAMDREALARWLVIHVESVHIDVAREVAAALIPPPESERP
jgi:hypothetical protein